MSSAAVQEWVRNGRPPGRCGAAARDKRRSAAAAGQRRVHQRAAHRVVGGRAYRIAMERHAGEHPQAGHGSDLSDILFCRLGTHLVVIESALSVDHRLHLGLQRLCEMRGMHYVPFPSATLTPADEPDVFVHRTLRDYEVDVAALETVLDGLPLVAPTGARPLGWA